MSACPTCKSERCGNHAACERREKSYKALALSTAERRRIWLLRWNVSWLYIGAYAYLSMLSSIENAADRQAEIERCMSGVTTEMLGFVVFATGDSAQRERSWDLALRMVAP